MRHRRFMDRAGFTRHCWECVHSHGWDGHIGFCDVNGRCVSKYDNPYNYLTIAGGCGHYSDGKEPDPKPMTNGERYRRVCASLTCRAEETSTIQCYDSRGITIHVMECSECGRTYEHVNGDYDYCPYCGRRIVREVDE